MERRLPAYIAGSLFSANERTSVKSLQKPFTEVLLELIIRFELMTSTWKEDMFPATPYLLFDDSKLATHDGYDPSNPLRQRGMLPLHQWANKTGSLFFLKIEI